MPLRLELPYPDPRLSPNARVHYYVRARAVTEAKEQVLVAVLSQPKLLRHWRPKPLERATVTITFVVPDKRRRDLGNCIASAKAYLDGLVDAGVIIDDSSKVITEVYPPMAYEKGVKKMIIEVEEA